MIKMAPLRKTVGKLGPPRNQGIYISFERFNLIWTGLFANLKRLGGGGQNGLSSNLAISREMTMKLGKGIL